LYTFEEEDPLLCRKLAFDIKPPNKNLLFNTKTRLKRTFCEKLRNNSLFGKKPTFGKGSPDGIIEYTDDGKKMKVC